MAEEWASAFVREIERVVMNMYSFNSASGGLPSL